MPGKSGIFVRGTGVFLRLKQINEGLDEELEKMALEIEAEAKKRCPVRTGRLRASIHTGRISEKVYYVGTNVEYAPFVEFGTRKMAARPYLRPAAKKVVNEYKSRGLFR